MKKTAAIILLFLFCLQGFAQDIPKDSILIRVQTVCRAKRKIAFTLENRTGTEIFRLKPVEPLEIYKWHHGEWELVPQVGYCQCSMECPPPPETMLMNNNEKLEFEWDQMRTICIDREKGSRVQQWSKGGKFKVVFEFRASRYGESFQIEKKFRIRCW